MVILSCNESCEKEDSSQSITCCTCHYNVQMIMVNHYLQDTLTAAKKLVIKEPIKETTVGIIENYSVML